LSVVPWLTYASWDLFTPTSAFAICRAEEVVSPGWLSPLRLSRRLSADRALSSTSPQAPATSRAQGLRYTEARRPPLDGRLIDQDKTPGAGFDKRCATEGVGVANPKNGAINGCIQSTGSRLDQASVGNGNERRHGVAHQRTRPRNAAARRMLLALAGNCALIGIVERAHNFSVEIGQRRGQRSAVGHRRCRAPICDRLPSGMPVFK
jgi:hypothetical protein